MEWLRWLLEILDGTNPSAPPLIIKHTTEIHEGGGAGAFQWVTAAIALVAATFAGLGARTALMTWKRSEEERAVEAAVQKRKQASQVVATVSMHQHLSGNYQSRATFFNRSDGPVYNVAVDIVDNCDGDSEVTEFKIIPPREDQYAYGKFYQKSRANRSREQLDVAIFFDDANNVPWVREADGTLHEFDREEFDLVAEEQHETNRTRKFWTREFWKGRSAKAVNSAG
jgi:hypothetical protein